MVGLAAACFADLNEEGFESYQEGELQNQKGWSPQAPDGEQGEYVAAKERMEIRRDPVAKNQYLVWKAGFGGKDQTRVLKSFAPTTGSKVRISFRVKPGGEDLGGGFYFDQWKKGEDWNGTIVSLRFAQGTFHVLEIGTKNPTDTGIAFKTDDWNHMELRLDFEKHKMDIRSERQLVGVFDLPAEGCFVNQINFFGGGKTFETALDDLAIESVDKFTDGQPAK